MAPSRGTGKPIKTAVKGKPSKSKKTEGSVASKSEDGDQIIPIALQQKLLNIFRDAFPITVESDYEKTLQEVKGHLYNRDFNQAFGKPEHLTVYALRWSASRALCYASIFDEILQLIRRDGDTPKVSIACLGGGAGAEVVGLAGALAHQQTKSGDHGIAGQHQHPLDLELRTTDIADWAATISALRLAVTSEPKLSAYASAASKAANCALVHPGRFTANFHQGDLLNIDANKLGDLVGAAHLITLMFTLNELYSASLPATQAFLQALGSVTNVGTLLLVVDSPGSYSTVTLNGNEKQYPMHWLLDHTLLQPDSETTEQSKWQKLRTEESTWFRLSDQLRYPIQLENMRYQLHLYRRT